jgi:hypothetical protein
MAYLEAALSNRMLLETAGIVFQMRAMHLYCDGLDAVLRIKALTYVLAMHLRAQRAFSKCSLTQIM